MKALIIFLAPSSLVNSRGRFCGILKATRKAIKIPLGSLFTMLLHVDPVLFLCCEMFSTIMAVPHRRLQLFVKLILKTNIWQYITNTVKPLISPLMAWDPFAFQRSVSSRRGRGHRLLFSPSPSRETRGDSYQNKLKFVKIDHKLLCKMWEGYISVFGGQNEWEEWRPGSKCFTHNSRS